MKVIIIFGKKDIGKTSAIVNVFNNFMINKVGNYTDFIKTKEGQLLNQDQNIVKDIFCSFTINNKSVGIFSAGDVKSDVASCLSIFPSGLDYIICAARSYSRPSVRNLLRTNYGINCDFINVNSKNYTQKQIEQMLVAKLMNYKII